MPQIAQRERREGEFEERIIEINRISRTVAGGRRIRFRAAVVIGDRNGRVGIGVAKATEVILAVQKAITQARKHLITVPRINGTIPHQVEAKFGSAKLMIKPARVGTGIIAGGAVRSIAELSGIENILSKILGSQNKINNLKATILALSSFKKETYEFPKLEEKVEPEEQAKPLKQIKPEEQIKPKKKVLKKLKKENK
jgi:small subunit ribosomal protein S5